MIRKLDENTSIFYRTFCLGNVLGPLAILQGVVAANSTIRNTNEAQRLKADLANAQK